jgi:hypothetical protein
MTRSIKVSTAYAHILLGTRVREVFEGRQAPVPSPLHSKTSYGVFQAPHLIFIPIILVQGLISCPARSWLYVVRTQYVQACKRAFSGRSGSRLLPHAVQV